MQPFHGWLAANASGTDCTLAATEQANDGEKRIAKHMKIRKKTLRDKETAVLKGIEMD